MWHCGGRLVRIHGNSTCAGDEAKGVVARLCILPEMDVGVVEDISMQIGIIECLHSQANVQLSTHNDHELTAKFA